MSAENIPESKARERRLHRAVYAMMDKYLHQGGNTGGWLEAFLTSSAAESVIRKLTLQDLAAFEDLVSAFVVGAVNSDDKSGKAFAQLTLRDFLRFEKRYFKRAALR
jgi:hypothetical protein